MEESVYSTALSESRVCDELEPQIKGAMLNAALPRQRASSKDPTK